MRSAITAAPRFRARLCAAWLAALATYAAPTAAADDDPLEGARTLFVLAYAAVEAGAPLPESADPDALRAYPLYPYLERARLMRELRRAPPGTVDAQVRTFLTAHAGEPVAADLRAAWLANLAEREEWGVFSAALDVSPSTPTLRCLAARAEIALAAPTALATAKNLWLTPSRLPPECEPVFDWLRSKDELTDDLVEARARGLLENGQAAFARTIAQRLPPPRAGPLLQWADLLDRPKQSIDIALSDAARARRTDDPALLAGFTKLSRNDPVAALERFERIAEAVGPERMGPYALALAFGLAWDRRAEQALDLFAVVPPGLLDDYALTWQARAALWSRDWPHVERTLAAMSPAQREQPRWRYWTARAAAERDDDDRAKSLYESLLPTDNYYAAMAAARLKRRAEPHPHALTADDATIATLDARPGFVRARELGRAGLRGPGVTEWLAAFAALTDSEQAQAVHLASRWQWHDIMVATATRKSVFFDYTLLYPRPHDREVEAAAKLADLEAPLLYGVIRQESLFRTDAVSSAGALGLAQLLPATARRVARAWQLPIPSTADLFEPAANVKLGAANLRGLANRFDGQLVVALAGYNAGENAAARWLPSAPLDSDIWIENIPFNETRDYVQRVLWHSVVFRWLETGRAENVDWWLKDVAPIASDEAQKSAR